MKSGSRGDHSCKRVRLPNVVEVDGAEVRGRLPLPPEHDDFSLAHATRAALMSCSGNKNMSAGLTATRQAQMNRDVCLGYGPEDAVDSLPWRTEFIAARD